MTSRRALEVCPIIRKNMPSGGGPNFPDSMIIVPSSGVIILVVGEHRSRPALPAVALDKLVLWGLVSASGDRGHLRKGAPVWGPLPVSLDRRESLSIVIGP